MHHWPQPRGVRDNVEKHETGTRIASRKAFPRSQGAPGEPQDTHARVMSYICSMDMGKVSSTVIMRKTQRKAAALLSFRGRRGGRRMDLRVIVVVDVLIDKMWSTRD